MTASNLTFDIVIVTRNRIDALKMSIPLMLEQSRQPENFILVDSSDNHQEVKALVEELTAGWQGQVHIIYESKPSITKQRNIGLQLVTSDVVMYPDDDSLWFPGVAEFTMSAYEKDVDGVVGGVCQKPVTVSPLEENKLNYDKNRADILKTILQPLRNKFENTFFPKPLILFAQTKWQLLPSISWLEKDKYTLVENMTGFRMSYRTRVIREFGFSEALGARVGYASCEDMDASLGVLGSNHHLVAALEAKVFHHKHYSQRAAAYSYGFCQIANYFYVVGKHMEKGSKPWSASSRFLLYKVFLYSLSYGDPYKRSIFKGAYAAYKERNVLLNAPHDGMDEAYLALCDKYLG